MYRASLVAQMVKNLPIMQETQVRSLGWEDNLEKGMDTHSSILAWKTPWTEEPDGLQSMKSQSRTRLSPNFPAYSAVSSILRIARKTNSKTLLPLRS